MGEAGPDEVAFGEDLGGGETAAPGPAGVGQLARAGGAGDQAVRPVPGQVDAERPVVADPDHRPR